MELFTSLHFSADLTNHCHPSWLHITRRTFKQDWHQVTDGSKILTPAIAFHSQILLIAFLKVLQDGSHMIMMECPDVVNTLLHEFFLWEPAVPQPSKKDSKARPETAKAQTDKAAVVCDTSKSRPLTAGQQGKT